MHEPRAWVVEANGILDVIINVSGINWNCNMIVFLLQSCERGSDLALLVRKQESFLGCESDLILVFVWYFPLVLQWDTRLVLYQNCLFCGNTLINWWEE